MADGEERLMCPFNNAHFILSSRMSTHLQVCGKKAQLPLSDKKVCHFNAAHFIDESEFQQHLNECPDRNKCDQQQYVIGPSAKEVSHLISTPSRDAGSREDWDSVENPSSYLQTREEVLEQRRIILGGETNMGRAERKAYRKFEVQRFQQLNGESVPSTVQENPVVSKPNTASRGRGRGVIFK